MNRRIVAIGSGLVVAATGVALVGSATAAAEGKDRVERESPPRFASARIDPAVRAESDRVVAEYVAAVNRARWVQAVNEARWVQAVNEARWREAAAAAAAASSHRSSSSSGGGAGVLSCIKHRESRGQYGAVNSSSGAAGAYQFMPSTWNNNARSAGRPDLVGVNPANASPADQDAMASHLLATQGLGPWGGGCG